MEVTNPRVRALLRQAKKTAEVGKRAAARQLYEQILEEAPETVPAWLGLARVASEDDARRSAYEQVLRLDPDNDAARRGLAQMEGLDGATPAEAPSAGTSPAEALSGTHLPAKTPRAQLEAGAAHKGADPLSQPRLDEAARPKSDGAAPAESSPAEFSAPGEETPAPAEEMPMPEAGATLVCYRHPGRTTSLRCITCNRPICTKCAQHTPVGYRCPQCIREAQDVFYSAGVVDYTVAGVVALILGLIAGAIVPRLNFFVIFVGPAVGILIGRFAFRAARRHHGRWLAHLVAGMVALGGLLPTVFPLLLGLLLGQVGLASLGLGLLWSLLYVFLATGAAYYQVK